MKGLKKIVYARKHKFLGQKTFVNFAHVLNDTKFGRFSLWYENHGRVPVRRLPDGDHAARLKGI